MTLKLHVISIGSSQHLQTGGKSADPEC